LLKSLNDPTVGSTFHVPSTVGFALAPWGLRVDRLRRLLDVDRGRRGVAEHEVPDADAD